MITALNSRAPLADQVVEAVVREIVSGRYGTGDALPPEQKIADLAKVSRLTVREAMKTLSSLGVISIQRGRGTFVNAPVEWSPFDPVLLAAQAGASGTDAEVAKQLLEARRLVEVGVAEFAARRRTAADLAAMEDAITRMEETDNKDLEAFAQADLDFHRAVMTAAGNRFVNALFGPIERLLYEGRKDTSRHADGRRQAIKSHRRIMEAIRARKVEGAKKAMEAHLKDTEREIDRGRMHIVFSATAKPQPSR